jgi:hypothetical protein
MKKHKDKYKKSDRDSRHSKRVHSKKRKLKKHKHKNRSKDSSSSDEEHSMINKEKYKKNQSESIINEININDSNSVKRSDTHKEFIDEAIIVDNSKHSYTLDNQKFNNLHEDDLFRNICNESSLKEYETNNYVDYSKPGSSKEIKEHYSRKHEKRKVKDSETEIDSDFTYLKYKHSLNKVLSNYNLVQNNEEFWVFVKKYESMERNVKKPSTNVLDDVNSIGIPEVYDKLHRLNFSIDYHSRELFANVQTTKDLTKEKLHKFKDIITIYKDFKHQENFQKLRKLRLEQANLPVAQYKNEIIQAVHDERVVIIAGDTGCGKSTQVPQYLYRAGFQKIGAI